MTDPRIAEGVKLVSELQRRLKDSYGNMALLTSEARTIIAALTAAGEMAAAPPSVGEDVDNKKPRD